MDAQLSEYMDNVQKQNDGVLLALQASAEVMNRLDTRLEKMDDDSNREREAVELQKEADEMEVVKSNLVKETATAVVDILKRENMVLNGDQTRKVNHKDIFNQGGGVNDAQTSPDLVTETSEVQKPLQAMIKSLTVEQYQTLQKHFLKEHAHMYEGGGDEGDAAAGMGEMGADVEEDVMESEDELGMNDDMEKDMHEEEEDDMGMGMDMESADYPMEEPDYEKMYKSLKANVNSEARKIAESTLKKQGWNREISRAPRKINKGTLGVETNATPMFKSQEDFVSQLKEYSEKSFGEICKDYMPTLSKSMLPPLDDNLLDLYS